MEKDLKEKIEILNELADIESLVKTNKPEFVYKERHFRVRPPTVGEKREANEKRTEKFIEYTKSDKYLTTKQLKEQHKKKGIDLDKIDEKIMDLKEKEKSLLDSLQKHADKKEEDEPKITKLKEKIEKVREQIAIERTEKEELLQCSIEQLLFEYLNGYFCYLLLEEKKDNKWQRVFKSYEDYENCDDMGLIIRAIHFLAGMVEEQLNVGV